MSQRPHGTKKLLHNNTLTRPSCFGKKDLRFMYAASGHDLHMITRLDFPFSQVGGFCSSWSLILNLWRKGCFLSPAQQCVQGSPHMPARGFHIPGGCLPFSQLEAFLTHLHQLFPIKYSYSQLFLPVCRTRNLQAHQEAVNSNKAVFTPQHCACDNLNISSEASV